MTRTTLERREDGTFDTRHGQTDQRNVFVLRTLTIEHRYHDDDPVQGASVSIVWPNGYVLETTLDEGGRATVVGAPSGSVQIKYGPDTREFRRVDDEENPDRRTIVSASDIDAIIDKYCG